MKLSTAIEGFIIHHTAAGYAPGTLGTYTWALNLVVKQLHDPELEQIAANDLLSFFAWLRTGYRIELAGSSLENAWKAIRSFYNWAAPEFGIAPRPDQGLPRPRYSLPQVNPYTPEEIAALLRACDRTAPASNQGYTMRRPTAKRDRTAPASNQGYTMRRPTAKRDRTIILLLLDTGLRVSEACRLVIADVDMQTGEIHVKPHGSGRKTKGRQVYIGKTTRSTLWRYLTTRDSHPTAPLLLTDDGRPMDRNSIRLPIAGLGSRANVAHAHPHRFRHTFAIQYLRNGGDVFTLQRLLGHSTLEMSRRYVALADADDQAAHNRASPVDRWKL